MTSGVSNAWQNGTARKNWLPKAKSFAAELNETKDNFSLREERSDDVTTKSFTTHQNRECVFWTRHLDTGDWPNPNDLIQAPGQLIHEIAVQNEVSFNFAACICGRKGSFQISSISLAVFFLSTSENNFLYATVTTCHLQNTQVLVHVYSAIHGNKIPHVNEQYFGSLNKYA